MTKPDGRARGARYIAFAGHARDGLGIAMWQADGTGPEPAATGHTFVTPIEPVTAHYYIASRDHGGIDPRARGGLAAHAPFHGFSGLAAALAHAGHEPRDLIIRLPLITPGADREGEDWSYRDGVETRRLRPQAPARLELAGEPFMALPVPVLVLTEDYRGARTFADVRLSLVSEPFIPVAADATDIGTVGRAFLDDVAGVRVRLVAESIALLEERFAGNGRYDGRFGEIPVARMEIVE